ncbi:MAG: hypothetical protein HMLKMBBP_00757 [Planctomycetes bacterium]|nr:hypothetical protein [Planctomycetota bacterium]
MNCASDARLGHTMRAAVRAVTASRIACAVSRVRPSIPRRTSQGASWNVATLGTAQRNGTATTGDQSTSHRSPSAAAPRCVSRQRSAESGPSRARVSTCGPAGRSNRFRT